MVRFRLTQSIFVGQTKYHGGEVVTDVNPPSVATDRVWIGLTAATMAPGMVPLDIPSQNMKAASAFADENVPMVITGVNSIA